MFTGLVLGSRELYGTLYHATVYTAPTRRPATSTTQHTTRVTRAATIVALVGIYFTTMPPATVLCRIRDRRHHACARDGCGAYSADDPYSTHDTPIVLHRALISCSLGMAADAVGAEDAKWLGDSSDSEGHVDDPERKHAESGSRCSSPCGTGLLGGQDDDASPQPSQERVCINLPVSGRVLEQALMYFAACDQHTGVLVAEPGSPGATLTSNITREDAVEMVAFADYVDSQRLLEFSAKMLGLHITTWAGMFAMTVPCPRRCMS